MEYCPLGVDWEGLAQLVEASDMPYRNEVLDILANTPVWVIRDGKVVDGRNRQLQRLAGGRVWWYMYEHFFPELRSSSIRVVCEIVRQAPEMQQIPAPPATVTTEVFQADSLLPTLVAIPTPVVTPKPPFYMAVKSNLLYDAALVPNIGVEFYIDKGWSIGANWMYAWWNDECIDWFWRIYGGELAVRKYFGKAAKENPLHGHHLGIYGEVFTYDFEVGGRGYIGGKPGGTLFDQANYGAGIEYGYSLPISKHFNLDFVIGVGYQGGVYWEYLPIDNHYVWQSTKQRNYFGPTKAEVTLVWLIGSYDFDKRGGGR